MRRWIFRVAFIPSFCSCSLLVHLQLEQILWHKWVCHCVWMGFSLRSNGRATPRGRFSQLSSRELNSWATHPQGLSLPFVGWHLWHWLTLLEMWKWKSLCLVAAWRPEPNPWRCGDTNSHVKRKRGATKGRTLFLFLTSQFSFSNLSDKGHISHGKGRICLSHSPARRAVLAQLWDLFLINYSCKGTADQYGKPFHSVQFPAWSPSFIFLWMHLVLWNRNPCSNKGIVSKFNKLYMWKARENSHTGNSHMRGCCCCSPPAAGNLHIPAQKNPLSSECGGCAHLQHWSTFDFKCRVYFY